MLFFLAVFTILRQFIELTLDVNDDRDQTLLFFDQNRGLNLKLLVVLCDCIDRLLDSVKAFLVSMLNVKYVGLTIYQ